MITFTCKLSIVLPTRLVTTDDALNVLSLLVRRRTPDGRWRRGRRVHVQLLPRPAGPRRRRRGRRRRRRGGRRLLATAAVVARRRRRRDCRRRRRRVLVLESGRRRGGSRELGGHGVVGERVVARVVPGVLVVVAGGGGCGGRCGHRWVAPQAARRGEQRHVAHFSPVLPQTHFYVVSSVKSLEKKKLFPNSVRQKLNRGGFSILVHLFTNKLTHVLVPFNILFTTSSAGPISVSHN